MKTKSSPTAPIGNLVLPVRGFWAPALLADFARQIVGGVRSHAQRLVGRVRILAVDAAQQRMWDFDSGAPCGVSEFAQGTAWLFFNPALTLSEAPPVDDLLRLAGENGAAWCGSESSRECYALSFLAGHLLERSFWAAMDRLTSCSGDPNGAEPDVAAPWIRPFPSGIDYSPALDGEAARARRPMNDSPRYWNTAMREILCQPGDTRTAGRDPLRMREALLTQRESSSVPWLFNALVNEIEYRLGIDVPQSYPPEVHLSFTGRCNIECGFCGYEHKNARTDLTSAAQVANLDFLRYVSTLRLNGGLGEPTLNRDLPAIIEFLADRYPHLYLNFFTNGIALNRPGLLAAMVGRVGHFNVSLNGASRDVWFNVCGGADHFDRICRNLRELLSMKKAQRCLTPVVHASIVLNSANVADLPKLPELCRELGIDRLAGFPYFGLGHSAGKFGGDMTLERCHDAYDSVYDETVREAERHCVSLELPPHGRRNHTVFGLEMRGLYDFAQIERNFWAVGRFLGLLSFADAPGAHCPFLWRTASIQNTNNCGHSQAETHCLYPCIGPLSGVDLSRQAPFRYDGSTDLLKVYNAGVFQFLRRGQREPGLSPVCDYCRANDTRDPGTFKDLQRLVHEFTVGVQVSNGIST